jgi:hypothetical protein
MNNNLERNIYSPSTPPASPLRNYSQQFIVPNAPVRRPQRNLLTTASSSSSPTSPITRNNNDNFIVPIENNNSPVISRTSSSSSMSDNENVPTNREINRLTTRRQFRNNMNLSNVFEQMANNNLGQPQQFELSRYPPFSSHSLNDVNSLSFNPNEQAFDAIEGKYVPITEYLNEEGAELEQRFILHLNNEYICQSLQGIKISNAYQGTINDFNEFYECKDNTPSEWQGNSYIRDWLKLDGRGPLVKIMGPGGSNYLIEKPSFFWDGPIPEPRVFNMVELPDKINKYISSFILPIRPNFSAYGVDHCNQLNSERVYYLESMKADVNKPFVKGGKKRKTKNRQTKRKQNRQTKRKQNKQTKRNKRNKQTKRNKKMKR